ncbi:MAG: alginate O-acetyltransferase [Spirochaetaceae bacterium]|nr:MAG: alginate O-acetyltransferase [Spirochaetaceae bacterium]
MSDRRVKEASTPILGVLLLAALGGGLLLSLLNPATARLSGHGELRSGQWMEAYQRRYEEELPLRDTAVGIWTALRYVLLREGEPGVIIGSDNWLFSDEEFARHPDEAHRITRNLVLIQQTQQRLQQRGIDLVVALVPAKARIYPQHLGRYRFPGYADARYYDARAVLTAMGVAVPDLASALRQAGSAGDVFLRTDTHWTPHGAHAAAVAIAASARPMLELRAAPRTDFVLRREQPVMHRGDLLNFLPLGPFDDRLGPPEESVAQYRARHAGDDAVGLFDEVAIPVTLVGTSYSAGTVWNFEAFLKAELQADVLNLAQEGRGPFAPMRDYLDGRTIDDVPAKLVIWEIPERYLPLAN